MILLGKSTSLWVAITLAMSALTVLETNQHLQFLSIDIHKYPIYDVFFSIYRSQYGIINFYPRINDFLSSNNLKLLFRAKIINQSSPVHPGSAPSAVQQGSSIACSAAKMPRDRCLVVRFFDTYNIERRTPPRASGPVRAIIYISNRAIAR